MRRLVTETAEVVGRADQAVPEHPLPESIDVDPCGEGVSLVDQKLRQFVSAAALTATDAVMLGTPLAQAQ